MQPQVGPRRHRACFDLLTCLLEFACCTTLIVCGPVREVQFPTPFVDVILEIQGNWTHLIVPWPFCLFGVAIIARPPQNRLHLRWYLCACLESARRIDRGIRVVGPDALYEYQYSYQTKSEQVPLSFQGLYSFDVGRYSNACSVSLMVASVVGMPLHDPMTSSSVAQLHIPIRHAEQVSYQLFGCTQAA